MAGTVYRRGGKIIDAGDMSADITSAVVDIQNAETIAIDLQAASATHVGSIYVQVSNDKSKWYNVTFDDGTSSVSVYNGSELASMVNISDIGAQWLRVFYDFTSGTGTLNSYCVLKR